METVIDRRVVQATEYIREHLGSPLTPSQMAQTVGVSGTTLTKMFRGVYGKTVTQYILEMRLKKAAELLISTSQPIKDIAVECGFKTVPHFARVFKEAYGLPPGKYRTTSGRELSPPMLDVVFETFTKNGIEYNNPGLLENILVIGFVLSEGPIDRLGSEERFAYLDQTSIREFVIQQDTVRSIVPFEKEYLNNLDVLRSHVAKGYPVRIWCALAHPEPLCEFAFVCDVLSDYECPVFVIRHPEAECAAFGYYNGDFAPFLELTQPLSREELEAQAALWRRLKEENAPLRVCENGTLHSAPIGYYDDRMTPWMPTEFGEVVCAEDLATRPDCYGDREMSPAWYQFRLRTMIEEGHFAVVPVIGEEKRTMIRHPAATAPYTMDDLLRIAAACRPLPPFPRAKHLPMPQVWVLLSGAGRLYCVKNDDIQTLLSLLKEYDDTVITKWVTLWGGPSGVLPPVDLPSDAARKAILSLDPSNAQTSILLRGENRLIEKTLAEIML